METKQTMPASDSRFYQFHVFALLALITLLYSFLFDPYRPMGPELLDNGDFSQGLAQWQTFEASRTVALLEGATVRLHSENPEGTVSLRQKIFDPVRFGRLRLSGEIRTRGVQGGKRDWQQARLVLAGYDGADKWLPARHHVALLQGTNGWQRYSQDFAVPAGARSLQVLVQLPRATGTMWARDLSLREVVGKKGTGAVSGTLLCLWGAFLVWLLGPIFRKVRPVVVQLLAAAVILAIFAGSLAPGEKKRQWQEDAVQAVQQIIEQSPASAVADAAPEHRWKPAVKTMLELSKVGHFTLFVLLAMVLGTAFAGSPLGGHFQDLALFAGATEFLQIFIRGRTPQVTDWLIDISGVLIGLALIYLLRCRVAAKTVEMSS